MSKTLYIADLDGTLLDRDGWLSDYTIHAIRRIIEEGHIFTIATARTLLSANDLLWLLGLRQPVILANGAVIYDTIGERHLHVAPMGQELLEKTLWVLESHGICGFLYALRDGRLSIYYRSFRHDWDSVYYAHRVELFGGRIYQVDDVARIANHTPSVYIGANGTFQMLNAAMHDLEHIHGITCEIYNDIYNDICFLDIFSSSASKGNAVLDLLELTGANELVSFGDSFNDMQMLLVADRCYVPRNGIAAARNIADETLDYAHRDSVAHFLARECGWEK